VTVRVHGGKGLIKAVSHEGDPVYLAWTTSNLSGWSTAVAAPVSLVNATVYARFGLLSAAGLAAVILAVVFAVLFGRRVIHPLTSLAHAVAETPDDRLLNADTGVAELDTLAAAFQTKLKELIAAGEARERVEQGLREREATLQNLVQTLDLAAAMIREWSGTISFWSHGCEVLYGWTAEDVIGRKVDDVLHTEYPIAKAELEAILVRDGGWSGDFIQSRRNGERIIVAVHKVIQRGEDGTPVAVLESFSDVSTLRQTQQELRELNQDLENRVREEVAAREVAQARAAHAERMQALGQLAGGIAHDMNNVLQAVTGSAALIERRPADTEGVRRFARMILDAGMRGISVTQRLLVFARKSDLRAEAIDAENLLIGIHELLSHTLGSAIAVRLGKAPDTCRLFADKAQLE
jgi:PAS domain S-box-containing protein